MLNRFAVLLAAGCFAASACSDDVGGDGGGGDASGRIDTGVILPGMDATASGDTGVDAGVMRRDATPADTGPAVVYNYGRKVADVPADIIGLSSDESELYYLDLVNGADRVMRVSTSTGAPVEIVSQRGHIVYTPFGSTRDQASTGASPIMWMMTKVQRIGGLKGVIRAYRTSTGTLRTLTGTSARDVVRVSPDFEWAIATENFEVILGPNGSARTSTRTADFVLINADGTQKVTLVQRANLGPWDGENNVFFGACTWNAAFTSSTTAVLLACPTDRERRTLYAIDVPSGRTSSVAEGVSRFLSVNLDGGFFLWQDRRFKLLGSPPDARFASELDEVDGIDSVQMIDRRRFVYNTADQKLRIASWPSLQPTTIQDFGAEAFRSVSPDANWVLFSQNDDFITDLFMISTSTATAHMHTILVARGMTGYPGYPGDDSFTADSSRVFWYRETNPNAIGDITTRRTDGTGPQNLVLAPQAYWVFNYANPDRVLLMLNSRQLGANEIISDLATRASDGSDESEILAADLRVNTRDFAIFPRSRRIAYVVPRGDNKGVWIRDLP